MTAGDRHLTTTDGTQTTAVGTRVHVPLVEGTSTNTQTAAAALSMLQPLHLLTNDNVAQD